MNFKQEIPETIWAGTEKHFTADENCAGLVAGSTEFLEKALTSIGSIESTNENNAQHFRDTHALQLLIVIGN